MTEFERKIYDAVCLIPEGRVATYGQIAQLAGYPRAARAVGNALHHNPLDGVVPCHRVVNAAGRLAPGFCFGGPQEQRLRLQEEGVAVVNYHVDLGEFGWDPDGDER